MHSLILSETSYLTACYFVCFQHKRPACLLSLSPIEKIPDALQNVDFAAVRLFVGKADNSFKASSFGVNHDCSKHGQPAGIQYEPANDVQLETSEPNGITTQLVTAIKRSAARRLFFTSSANLCLTPANAGAWVASSFESIMWSSVLTTSQHNTAVDDNIEYVVSAKRTADLVVLSVPNSQRLVVGAVTGCSIQVIFN
jgi:hypothetical protein